MISSASSAALLEMFEGYEERRAALYPRSMGPTLVKIADPLEDIELAVELLDEATPAGRRRNRRVRQKQIRGAGTDRAGNPTFNGRGCCAKLVQKLDASLHIIAIPSEWACSCGSVYRVQQSIREERHHGR